MGVYPFSDISGLTGIQNPHNVPLKEDYKAQIKTKKLQ